MNQLYSSYKSWCFTTHKKEGFLFFFSPPFLQNTSNWIEMRVICIKWFMLCSFSIQNIPSQPSIHLDGMLRNDKKKCYNIIQIFARHLYYTILVVLAWNTSSKWCSFIRYKKTKQNDFNHPNFWVTPKSSYHKKSTYISKFKKIWKSQKSPKYISGLLSKAQYQYENGLTPPKKVRAQCSPVMPDENLLWALLLPVTHECELKLWGLQLCTQLSALTSTI